MTVVPAALPAVAIPLASMVASNVLLDAQATVLVQFVVVLSLQWQVAVYCNVENGVMEALSGEMVMLTSVGPEGVTVSVSPGLVIVPLVAVIDVVPAATAVARPPAATVATLGVPLFHVEVLVRFWVLLSL